MFIRIIQTAILAGFLGACAGTMALNEARSTSVSGDDFSRALYQGYMAIAQAEKEEADWPDLERFANKALAVARRGDTAPDGFGTRVIASQYQGEMRAARSRLVAARSGGGRDLAPYALARAQVRFDCWMQEQEEDWQPRDIAACKTAFLSAMSQVDSAIERAHVPPEPLAGPIAPMRPQVHGTPERLDPQPSERQHIVFFDFDSARLDSRARRVMAEILAAIDTLGETSFTIDGHADRAGPRDYNLALSARRLEAVVSYLVASGVARASITLEAHGEDDPAVDTDDGVREPRNRRVRVRVD